MVDNGRSERIVEFDPPDLELSRDLWQRSRQPQGIVYRAGFVRPGTSDRDGFAMTTITN